MWSTTIKDGDVGVNPTRLTILPCCADFSAASDSRLPRLRDGGLGTFCACRLTDRTAGFYPADRGSIPRGRTTSDPWRSGQRRRLISTWSWVQIPPGLPVHRRGARREHGPYPSFAGGGTRICDHSFKASAQRLRGCVATRRDASSGYFGALLQYRNTGGGMNRLSGRRSASLTRTNSRGPERVAAWTR